MKRLEFDPNNFINDMPKTHELTLPCHEAPLARPAPKHHGGPQLVREERTTDNDPKPTMIDCYNN